MKLSELSGASPFMSLHQGSHLDSLGGGSLQYPETLTWIGHSYAYRFWLLCVPLRMSDDQAFVVSITETFALLTSLTCKTLLKKVNKKTTEKFCYFSFYLVLRWLRVYKNSETTLLKRHFVSYILFLSCWLQ